MKPLRPSDEYDNYEDIWDDTEKEDDLNEQEY